MPRTRLDEPRLPFAPAQEDSGRTEHPATSRSLLVLFRSTDALSAPLAAVDVFCQEVPGPEKKHGRMTVRAAPPSGFPPASAVAPNSRGGDPYCQSPRPISSTRRFPVGSLQRLLFSRKRDRANSRCSRTNDRTGQTGYSDRSPRPSTPEPGFRAPAPRRGRRRIPTPTRAGSGAEDRFSLLVGIQR